MASSTSSSSLHNQPPNFILPPKTRNVIDIVRPTNQDALKTSEEEVRHEQKGAASQLDKSNGPSSVYDNPSTDSSLQNHNFQSVYKNVARDPNQDLLDVFAIKFIPLWLQVVNQSYAHVYPCRPLNTTDFADYIASFAGSTYLQPLEDPTIPSIIKHPSLSQDTETLDLVTYKDYWYRRVANENAFLHEELRGYSVYDVPIRLENPTHQLYKFHITGLQENAPRVDLGDTVLVRPLASIARGRTPQRISHETSKEAAMWCTYVFTAGGTEAQKPSPGFTGMEFHATVWGVSRAKQEILLRIDNLPSHLRKCNLMFVLQDPKILPLYRAIDVTSELLRQTSSWLNSMLFPSISHTVMQESLSKGLFDLRWFDADLNFEQKKAVAAIINADYGHVPYLISGPPGTGKTKTIVETALQLLKHPRMGVQPHLLICAPSDAAADTLATRLSRHLTPKELFRLNGWTRTFAEVPDKLMLYCYSENDLFTLPRFSILMSFKVVVTTCRDADLLVQAQVTNNALTNLAGQTLSAIAPATTELPLNLIHWTALLLDEAAQATEPECLVPLSVLAFTIPSSHGSGQAFQPQTIMAGDEFQLGPRLASRTEKTGLEISLFQRLFERPFYADHPLSRNLGSKPLTSKMLPLPRAAFTNLIRNYRSHPAILSTPSNLFYHNTLVPERLDISPILRSWSCWVSPLKWPILFKQNSSPDAVEDVLGGDGTGGGNLKNAGEVEAALTIVTSLFLHTRLARSNLVADSQFRDHVPISQQDVIVMSPFRTQVARLRLKFRHAGFHGVNIGPLEAFQGLEARVVIICTTRTRLGASSAREMTRNRGDKFIRQDQARSVGIIDEPKRFNVALTRAKEGLIVIGDARTLTCTGDRSWIEFIGFCARNGCVEDDEGRHVEKLGFENMKLTEGRLEKALKFAASKNETAESVRKLGMRMYDEEEAIWLKGGGLTLPDRNQNYNVDENDDIDNNGYDGNNSDDHHREEVGQLRIDGATVENGDGPDYDRDMEKEFNCEGCEMQ